MKKKDNSPAWTPPGGLFSNIDSFDVFEHDSMEIEELTDIENYNLFDDVTKRSTLNYLELAYGAVRDWGVRGMSINEYEELKRLLELAIEYSKRQTSSE